MLKSLWSSLSSEEASRFGTLLTGIGTILVIWYWGKQKSLEKKSEVASKLLEEVEEYENKLKDWKKFIFFTHPEDPYYDTNRYSELKKKLDSIRTRGSLIDKDMDGLTAPLEKELDDIFHHLRVVSFENMPRDKRNESNSALSVLQVSDDSKNNLSRIRELLKRHVFFKR